MTILRTYKFQIAGVVQVVDDYGHVTGEQVVSGEGGRALEVFGLDGLQALVDEWETNLAKIKGGQIVGPNTETPPALNRAARRSRANAKPTG